MREEKKTTNGNNNATTSTTTATTTSSQDEEKEPNQIFCFKGHSNILLFRQSQSRYDLHKFLFSSLFT